MKPFEIAIGKFMDEFSIQYYAELRIYFYNHEYLVRGRKFNKSKDYKYSISISPKHNREVFLEYFIEYDDIEKWLLNYFSKKELTLALQ